MLGEDVFDLVETIGMVGDDLLESALKSGEPVLVGRKDFFGPEVLDLEE
ncbi:MAG: hypothetical protein ABSC41_20010 [Acidimicrobiales bacterium]